MKWTIPELKKLRTTGNRFSYTADFERFLTVDDDVVAISPVTISGAFRIFPDPEEFVFEVTVKCTLVMACAITLADVEVPLDFVAELTFAETPTDDSAHMIEGITIDLDPYVWGEILVEKPMRVVAEGASEAYREDPAIFTDDERPEMPNPFAKLKQPK